MIEEEKKLRLQQLKLIVCVMFVLFAFMLAYTIYWIVDYNARFDNCNKTSAQITSHKKIDGITYDVFKYNVEGHEYIITGDIPSVYDVGEVVDIYYDKDSPICLVYDIDNRQVILPVITSCFGVGCVGLCVVYFVVRAGINKPAKLSNRNKVKKRPSKEVSDGE